MVIWVARKPPYTANIHNNYASFIMFIIIKTKQSGPTRYGIRNSKDARATWLHGSNNRNVRMDIIYYTSFYPQDPLRLVRVRRAPIQFSSQKEVFYWE